MISGCLVATVFALGVSAGGLANEDSYHPTCAWVEVKQATDLGDGENVEYIAPGHCMRMRESRPDRPRSRYFNCYSGCGGSKLQYKEYASEDCTGTMIEDTMLHKGKMDPFRTTEGTVTAFDCALAYCHVSETTKSETNEVTHYKPADRKQCVKDHSGYQWSECLDKRYLQVHHGPTCGSDPAESKKLTYDDARVTEFHGIVRDWDCNGFDNPYDDEEKEHEFMMQHMMMLHNVQAERRKADLALRTDRIAAKEREDEVGRGMVPMLLFAGAVLSCGYYVYRKHCNAQKEGSSPMLRPSTKYERLSTEEAGVTV